MSSLYPDLSPLKKMASINDAPRRANFDASNLKLGDAKYIPTNSSPSKSSAFFSRRNEYSKDSKPTSASSTILTPFKKKTGWPYLESAASPLLQTPPARLNLPGLNTPASRAAGPSSTLKKTPSTNITISSGKKGGLENSSQLLSSWSSSRITDSSLNTPKRKILQTPQVPASIRSTTRSTVANKNNNRAGIEETVNDILSTLDIDHHGRLRQPMESQNRSNIRTGSIYVTPSRLKQRTNENKFDYGITKNTQRPQAGLKRRIDSPPALTTASTNGILKPSSGGEFKSSLSQATGNAKDNDYEYSPTRNTCKKRKVMFEDELLSNSFNDDSNNNKTSTKITDNVDDDSDETPESLLYNSSVKAKNNQQIGNSGSIGRTTSLNTTSNATNRSSASASSFRDRISLTPMKRFPQLNIPKTRNSPSPEKDSNKSLDLDIRRGGNSPVKGGCTSRSSSLNGSGKNLDKLRQDGIISSTYGSLATIDIEQLVQLHVSEMENRMITRFELLENKIKEQNNEIEQLKRQLRIRNYNN